MIGSLYPSYEDEWPGDPAFASVFDELNRRKAVAFIHPPAPACCRKLQPGPTAARLFPRFA
jgi:hypothetical protein